jgi:hypothetical protein
VRFNQTRFKFFDSQYFQLSNIEHEKDYRLSIVMMGRLTRMAMNFKRGPNNVQRKRAMEAISPLHAADLGEGRPTTNNSVISLLRQVGIGKLLSLVKPCRGTGIKVAKERLNPAAIGGTL